MWFMQAGLSVTDVVIRILSVLVIIFLILPFHEYAHGFIAYKLGDHTAKNSGRLTLNPLVSIDPMGALGILLFGFGWARPIPINPNNFSNPKKDTALTALAGPSANLIAAFLGAILLNLLFIFRFYLNSTFSTWIALFFNYYISINVGLAVFNLLPIPPLDGSKILAAFLSDRIIYKYYKYQNITIVVVFALLFTGVLSVPLGYMQIYIYNLIMNLASLPFNLIKI